MSKRRTKAQIDWCEKYKSMTGFEPLLDDFKAGNESFTDAAKKSVDWFESWYTEAIRSIDKYPEAQ